MQLHINEEPTVICHKSPFKALWIRALSYSATEVRHRSQSQCQSSLRIICEGPCQQLTTTIPIHFFQSLSACLRCGTNVSPAAFRRHLTIVARLQSGRWRRERQIRVYGNESIRLNSDRQIVLSTELLQRRAALRAAGTVLNTIRRLFKQRER